MNTSILTLREKRQFNKLMQKGYSPTVAFKMVTNRVDNSIATRQTRKIVESRKNKATYNY